MPHQLGYSPQASAKATEGRRREDRDGVFRYLNDMAAGFIDNETANLASPYGGLSSR